MPNHKAVEQYLTQCLAQTNLSIDEAACRGLVHYVELLVQWNRAYNLTSIRDPMEIVRRHILDSLVILPYLYGTRLLDLGTGAGLPGMILAIARPDVECVLLDGNGKKTRFCIQAAMALGLLNVEVLCERVEKYTPEILFSTVTARAFGHLSVLWNHAQRLLVPRGRLLAMKGTVQEAGSSTALKGKTSKTPTMIALTVPDLAAERHLMIVEHE
uniref:Ribosomal RNA small subunit methyltransferase G n=1 Tax=Candidatus Kentrum eta TaxID=2126337 RepID=A0A450VJK8_9GAMM|nr:MAG: 16S rRNA (guanine527-N7)-methyltransferase [Candidatus Kentron sp. H]VFK01042.1 MAG: 16S rRNA (guanine527-N7)-methyltransferase [Candidatus Kentron sp. H]VFK04921.1 MAG: 16S rRNA (guanine527-N7)-methyltransferase [Candidatus Kentron sp. H]